MFARRASMRPHDAPHGSRTAQCTRWWSYLASRGIAGQGASFVLVGSALVLIDWSTFVVLSALGIVPVVANVIGRVTGALLGFWLNGHVTFGSGDAPRLGRGRFMRYALLWIVLTLLSTLLMVLLSWHLGLYAAWLVKPIVEAVMALLSFLVSRHWVYL